MGLRKTSLATNEIYHIYNRGVDKRNVFLNEGNICHFFEGLKEFNRLEPIGSLYENAFKKNKPTKNQLGGSTSKLVEIIAYCINPNHFHLILRQNTDKGIEKFMQKIGTSYTMYFNNKNKRKGALFQGRFKSKHVDTNEYLLYLSAYVNLNDKIHGIDNKQNITASSLKEYIENINNTAMCEKSIIIDQFKNKIKYKKFLDNSLEEMMRQKGLQKELEE